MTTYHEVAKTTEKLLELQQKLKAKNFEEVEDAFGVSIWFNPSTDERVVIEK